MKKGKLPAEYRARRDAAEMLDEETYEGRPCIYGHPGTRIIKYNGACLHCYRSRSSTYEGPHARRSLAITAMWRGAKHRAEAAGLPFDIGREDITFPTHCPISGKPMTRPSLDRRDNSKGYVKGNVFVVSWEMNRLKDNGTIEDFENILRYMRAEQHEAAIALVD